MIPNLKQKLQAMVTTYPSHKFETEKDSAPDNIATPRRAADKVAEEDNLGGIVRESVFGRHVVKRTVCPLAKKHGCISLEGLNYINNGLPRIWTKTAEQFVLEDLVFLDTETTGLAGGTGTVAFLVGLGYIFEGQLIVEQHIMRDFDEEISMLQDVVDVLMEHKALVTFNGKSFDWPLLESRFITAKIRPYPDYTGNHIDLLHTARRLWKLKYKNCNLTRLEQKVMNMYREDDIPGFLIPSVYCEYLESRNSSGMMRIIEHNLQDIETLAALFAHVDYLYSQPPENIGEYELFGIASDLEQQKKYSDAIDCYKECIKRSRSSTLRQEAKKRAAYLLKKERKYEEALILWEQLSEDDYIHSMLSNIEIAKYFEHKARKYSLALKYTEKALRIALSKNNQQFYTVIQEVKHRQQRLINKIEKERMNKV